MIRVADGHLARFRRSRDIASLISLYEANHARLLRLVPDLDHFENPVVSRVAGTPDLYLGVLERRPYTTTLGLTYRFCTSSGPVFRAERTSLRLPRCTRGGAVELLSAPPRTPTLTGQGETHARDRSKVEHESLSAQVAEVLHSSGASFPGLHDPGGSRHVPLVARPRLVRLQVLRAPDGLLRRSWPCACRLDNRAQDQHPGRPVR